MVFGVFTLASGGGCWETLAYIKWLCIFGYIKEIFFLFSSELLYMANKKNVSKLMWKMNRVV